ncbi:hypothetical protein AYI69_g3316 [Smittium culicis]|uniref:Uncharacterized protein n=1 Tax=Smittium culicis TaxID=133412 RepID=A0A1R1YK38_9FUNG|nr:hypothetical protein AYI69_g3316 [Smittium culicis]
MYFITYSSCRFEDLILWCHVHPFGSQWLSQSRSWSVIPCTVILGYQVPRTGFGVDCCFLGFLCVFFGFECFSGFDLWTFQFKRSWLDHHFELCGAFCCALGRPCGPIPQIAGVTQYENY